MIDRGLQHYISCELRDAYPNSVDYSKKYDYDSVKYNKFEADQFKQIIESKIKESELSNDVKSSAISTIKSLPAESIKHLTTLASDYGLDNTANLIDLLNNLPT